MDSALEKFCRIIQSHTGLLVPDHDRPYLREKLSRRLQATRIGAEELYLALLSADGPATEAEWRSLVLELTTGESYFFRDSGQMRLLREVIFPELMRQRAATRSLRIWSAGCSTGEEPYSLAIILHSLLAGAGSWQIMLKGTDINEYALQKAREGRYSRWAFRGVSEEQVERHFLRGQNEWQVDATIRNMVVYERLNLIKESYPDPGRGLYDLDLIVCRNVFIYFSHEAIAGIMAQFAASLRPGGYILTGHAEVQQPVSQLVAAGVLPLVARQFPDSVIFQRPLEGDTSSLTGAKQPGGSMASSVSSLPVAKIHPVLARRKGGEVPDKLVTERALNFSVSSSVSSSASPSASFRVNAAPSSSLQPSAEKRLQEARALFDKGQYAETIRQADSLTQTGAVAGEANILLARAYANVGEASKAEQCCREALRQRPFAAEPQFLLANLLHDRGDSAQAKELLKKVLYLDRNHVPAYLQLAEIFQEEGASERARQMRLGALDVLHGLPLANRLEHYEEWTVKELVEQLERLLGER
ncbi:CheR family methyltransferase [Candidatus Magnetaquicoccus inordinatus]|uniref:CheR family methyltransferase n=1 Tax=Candidatus Magnetaquicoccus inordinatus TaxID=2496818 RepID=UPI00102B243E|nr:CheR family methyltransferase [Candidatus Magnetaquicoccus inordinatus]